MTLGFSLIAKNSTISATKKMDYGSQLKLNKKIKLNKNNSFTVNGYYKKEIFIGTQKVKVSCSVKCKRKKIGANYRANFNVKLKYLSKPETREELSSFGNWKNDYIQPIPVYTIFDYQTGKSLELSDGPSVWDAKKDIRIKSEKWKYKYYPKVKFQVEDETETFKAYKSASISFSITYPQSCKNVIVGTGVLNSSYFEDLQKNGPFYAGTIKYGKSSLYKNGKNTIGYIRL